jgi:hypothetical protein
MTVGVRWYRSGMAKRAGQFIEGGKPAAWPTEAKELAYQLWAYKHGQRAYVTAKALQAGEDCPPGVSYAVNGDTVAYWAKSENWALRAAEDRRLLAPGHEERMMQTAMYGSVEGLEWARAVANGSESVRSDRVRLDCTALLLQVQGWLGPERRHAGQREGVRTTGRTLDPSRLRNLSDAELAELERSITGGRSDRALSALAPEPEDTGDDASVIDIDPA